MTSSRSWSAINGGAVAVLKCSKMIEAWDTVTIPRNVQLILTPNLPPVKGTCAQGTFYDRVGQDKEILKVVLLLTGSIQTARSECDSYLSTFSKWNWLWTKVIDEEYARFEATQPTLDEFELKLREFADLDAAHDEREPRRQISALILLTGSLVQNLKDLAARWKESFARHLHRQTHQRLEALSEVIKRTMNNMNREVDHGDIDALGVIMKTLQHIRAKQSVIETELEPIGQMYSILDTYLPNLLNHEEHEAIRDMNLSKLWRMMRRCF